MSDPIQTVSYRDLGYGAVDRNRVLRNTYTLLAISLVPTVLGAWLGETTGLYAVFSGILGMMLFMAIAFGFMFAIERIGAAASAQAGMVGPLSTVVLGVWVLHEPFNQWVLAGAALVLLGVWLLARAR